MIKDDDFLIIASYTIEFKGVKYLIQEARMRSRYDNPGQLYGDTFKFYTRLDDETQDE